MSGSNARHWEQNKEATVYVGNIHEAFERKLLWELMVQCGRVRDVNMPVDRVNGKHQGFGFVEFKAEQDAEYAALIMNNIKIYGTPLRINKASADKQKNVEIGAELFVGNLDTMVDERTLFDTFHRFGHLIAAPKIARDDHNMSKGYGFISYNDFDASDAAIAAMNGQYILNKQISVQYAYKKDGKGERHGDEAERTLAKQAKAHGVAPEPTPLPAHLFQAPAGAVPTGPQAGAGAPGFGARPPPTTPLPPAPQGLPARPPSGAPGNFYPPAPSGFGAPPPPGYGPPGFSSSDLSSSDAEAHEEDDQAKSPPLSPLSAEVVAFLATLKK